MVNRFFVVNIWILLALAAPAAWGVEGEGSMVEDEPAAVPEVRYEEVRAGPFRIIAPDRESAITARTVATELIAMVDRFVELPPERMPMIEVRLAPPGYGNMEGRMQLYAGRVGDYGLVMRWDADTAMADFAERMTEVYLRQIVFTQTDRDIAERVPDWLISAMGLRLQVRMRPGLRLYLQEISQGIEVPPLAEVLASGDLNSFTLADRLRHFWLLEMLNRLTTGESRRRNFFGAILTGANAMDQLVREEPSIGENPAVLETWWVVGLQEEIWRRTVPSESLEQSRERLARLWTFELVRDGEPFYPEPESLWELRQNEVFLGLTESKIQMIEVSVGAVNPAASNAYLAWGQALTALRDGRKSEFRSRLEEAGNERAVLDEIVEEVRMIRGGGQSRSPAGEGKD